MRRCGFRRHVVDNYNSTCVLRRGTLARRLAVAAGISTVQPGWCAKRCRGVAIEQSRCTVVCRIEAPSELEHVSTDGFETTHTMRLAGRGGKGVGAVFGKWLETNEGACGTASDSSEHRMSLDLRSCQLAGKLSVEQAWSNDILTWTAELWCPFGSRVIDRRPSSRLKVSPRLGYAPSRVLCPYTTAVAPSGRFGCQMAWFGPSGLPYAVRVPSLDCPIGL